MANIIRYFAYGSNMSVARLIARTPSAKALGCYSLPCHDLKFHKRSHDGSAKCDAFYTGNKNDVIHGVLFDLCASEKPLLDHVEGLGLGYEEKEVTVLNSSGDQLTAVTYYATDIKQGILPYSWYHHHVLFGAMEHDLPANYVQEKIAAIAVIEDPNSKRASLERSLYN